VTTNVVIVGAPRSGTNMLRDVLTTLPGVATWPCDEVNLLWRHGNRAEPSDELTPAMARPGVADYIRDRFDRIHTRYDAHTVVEKTCATSLRVEFVRAVLPDAKYVFITRDGIDAAVSAGEQWRAPFDLRYTAAKARFVPPGDVPYYAARFLAGRVRRRQKPSEGRVATWWGPRPRDYQELMRVHPLDELCAIQWQRCVDASVRGVDGLPSDQLMHVGYEDFVTEPAAGLARITDFLGLSGFDAAEAVRRVSNRSIGKGRKSLGAERLARLEQLVRPSLRRLRNGQ
jgi:hypothetical protein